MEIIQNFLLIFLKLPIPHAGLGSSKAKETAGGTDGRPALEKHMAAPHCPAPTQVSPFHSPVIAPEKEGIRGLELGISKVFCWLLGLWIPK